jgi:NitT/TauT family transport system substrate-binding protein
MRRCAISRQSGTALFSWIFKPSLGLALVAVGVFCGAFSGSTALAADTISVATIRGAPTMRWPLYIAEAKGMFAERGIKIELNNVLSANNVAQDVASGSINLGTVGLVEPVRAAAKGAGVAIIREEGALPPFALMAKPTIESLADLKGKTVSLGGIADSTEVYFERMLSPVHLTPNQVDKVYAGSTADRFAQLKSGAVDAALLLPPFDSLAAAANFRDLGDTKDYVKDLPFSGYMVNVSWAKAHPDLVRKFLSGYQEAVDWFYNKANRAEAIAIAVHLTKDSPDVDGKTYDTLYRLQFFDKTGVITKTRLENLIACVKELGPLDRSVEPAQLILPGITHYVDK